MWSLLNLHIFKFKSEMEIDFISMEKRKKIMCVIEECRMNEQQKTFYWEHYKISINLAT